MYSPPTDIPETFQHYLRMWNERDSNVIRRHLDLAVSEDCIWVDPQNDHVGRNALEENVRTFRKKYSDADLKLGSNIDGHHRRYRYEWIISVGSAVLVRGFDVATVNQDGMIERVDGFFGMLEPLE